MPHRLLDRHRALLPADRLHRLRATEPAAGGGGVHPPRYDSLDRDLNAARKVLYENRAAALEAIRPILENERQDSFLIIDLANVLVAMESDRDSQTLAAAAIERANVELHPRGTVQALAWMASRQCGPCLPAMFRVLELPNPRPTIPEFGRALNPDEVLIFTLGQYGDAALPGLLAALASDNCTVRAIAARSLRWVRPDEVPAALREMARTDFCHGARDEAWHVLGEIDDPELPDLARRRLEGTREIDGHDPRPGTEAGSSGRARATG